MRGRAALRRRVRAAVLDAVVAFVAVLAFVEPPRLSSPPDSPAGGREDRLPAFDRVSPDPGHSAYVPRTPVST